MNKDPTKQLTPLEKLAIAKKIEESERTKWTSTVHEFKTMVAKKSGFGSRATLNQVDLVVRRGSKEVIDAMDSGALSIRSAYNISKPKALHQNKTKTTINESRLYSENSPVSARAALKKIEREISLISKNDQSAPAVIQKIIDICQSKLTRLTGEHP